jgi:RHS repeat-associated protein
MNGGAWELYYIHRDPLGSITGLSNTSGTLMYEYSYDPWGRLRNPANHVAYLPDQVPELFLGRGFTGHEHLPQFGLINMNARLYDPVLGRFLSPDPYIQAPDFSQSLNRYSYCLNNPLMYVDPDGEKWWHWLLGITLIDPVSTITSVSATVGWTSITAATTAGMVGTSLSVTGLSALMMASTNYIGYLTFSSSASATMSLFDFTSIWLTGLFDDPIKAGERFTNYLKIEAGHFLHIPVWESAQMYAGNAFAHLRNALGYVDNVEIWRWTVLVNQNDPNTKEQWGMTLGPYINSKNVKIGDLMYMHEYGHTIQSRILGIGYMDWIALPSGLSELFVELGFMPQSSHDNNWTEVWANQLVGLPASDKYLRGFRSNSWWYWLFNTLFPHYPN